MNEDLIYSVLTEEEISNFISANDIEDNANYSDALNWILALDNDDISVKDVLIGLIKDESFTISDLYTAYNHDTEAERLSALETLLSIAPKAVSEKIFDAFVSKFKELNIVTYEKFFKYISRKYKDPSIYAKNEDIEELSSDSSTLSDSAKYTVYTELVSLYNSLYYDSSINNSMDILYKLSKNFLYILVNNPEVFNNMSTLEIDIWPDITRSFIANDCPLILNPLTNTLSSDIFASDAPIGFMLRLLNESNFYYNPDELKLLLLRSIAYTSKNLTETEIATITASSDKEIILSVAAKYIKDFFEADTGLSTNFCENSDIDQSTEDRKAAFNALFYLKSNRQFIYNYFLYNFDNMDSIVAIESAIIPVINEYIPWNATSGFNAALENVMTAMGLVSNELDIFTDKVIDLYESGTDTAEG